VLFDEVQRYIPMFIAVFLPGIGIPPFVPEEAMIAVNAGLLVKFPELRWYLAWPATLIGVVSADAVLYWFGRLCGPQLFERPRIRKVLKPERLTRLQGGFDQHGFKILLTARMLAPIRAVAFIFAGAIKYPFHRFLLADGFFVAVAVSAIFFGSAWVITWLYQVGPWAVVAAAALAVTYFLYRYYRQLRQPAEEDRVTSAAIKVLELAASDKATNGTTPHPVEPAEASLTPPGRPE
jgi:membrane protein DedA with SNARE-associated domain